jgi:hypothetical protein
VFLQSPISAFGELSTISATPIAQVLFTYGINNNTITTTTANGGSTSVSNGLVSLISGGTAGGTASITSVRPQIYKPGQGALARFTAIFTTGVASTTQIAGVGTSVNGFFFGYNGASFGVLHRNNSSDTWIPQTSWNADTLDGSSNTNNPSGMLLDKTKGNVYEIKYQFLGFGKIEFYVEDQTTGNFIVAHRILYANTAAVPSLTNPTLKLLWEVINTAGSSVTLQAASCGLYIEGEQQYLGPRYGLDNNKAAVTTLINIITLRCRSTINGITNLSQIRLRNISFAAADNGYGVSTLQVLLNPTVGGTPSFTQVDATNSITEYDTAGTTITGGIVKFNTSVAMNGNAFLDVTDLGIIINPGEQLVFAAKSTNATTIAVSVCFSEEI